MRDMHVQLVEADLVVEHNGSRSLHIIKHAGDSTVVVRIEQLDPLRPMLTAARKRKSWKLLGANACVEIVVDDELAVRLQPRRNLWSYVLGIPFGCKIANAKQAYRIANAYFLGR